MARHHSKEGDKGLKGQQEPGHFPTCLNPSLNLGLSDSSRLDSGCASLTGQPPTRCRALVTAPCQAGVISVCPITDDPQ